LPVIERLAFISQLSRHHYLSFTTAWLPVLDFDAACSSALTS
jgi:hypothetical protein